MTEFDRIKHKIRECGDCWEWIGNPKSEHGKRYPQASIDGKWWNVRRYVYSLHKELRSGLSVVPKCGNPYCINPEHCKALTERQKCQQAAAKGAYSSVARSKKIAVARRRAFAKLDEAKVAEIRESDESGPKLAARYGIDKSLVNRIRRGEAWKDYSSPFAGLLAANDNRRAA
jgi:hypothetical protein